MGKERIRDIRGGGEECSLMHAHTKRGGRRKAKAIDLLFSPEEKGERRRDLLITAEVCKLQTRENFAPFCVSIQYAQKIARNEEQVLANSWICFSS